MNALTFENREMHRDLRVSLNVRLRQSFAMLQHPEMRSVLDVGCGDGGFLHQFPPECAKFGVDVAENIHRVSDVRFTQCDVTRENLPFKDNVFDGVFAGEVIEHVLDTSRFLGELWRVTRPGGHVVITTPNLCSIKNLYRWFRREQLDWVDYDSGQTGHVRYFAPKSLASAVTKAGFEVNTMCSSGFEVGCHWPVLSWLTPVTQVAFSHSLRGNCLIVKCSKRGC